MTCVMGRELVQCDCHPHSIAPQQACTSYQALPACSSTCRPADKPLLFGVQYHSSALQSGAHLLEALTVRLLIEGKQGAGPLLQALLLQQPIQSTTSDEPFRGMKLNIVPMLLPTCRMLHTVPAMHDVLGRILTFTTRPAGTAPRPPAAARTPPPGLRCRAAGPPPAI
jgi:hypothetical protein